MKLCNVCGDPKHANQFRKGEWVCNTGLGLFRDNATTLEIAAHYLREHKGEE
jgi:hypothetical protein